MFEQSLLESASVAASRRGLTTSLSALAQLALLGIAILLPMVFTNNLPIAKMRELPPVIRPTPPPEPEQTVSSRETGPATGIAPVIVTNAFPRVRSLATETTAANPALPLPVGGSGSPNYDLPIGTNSVVRGPSAPLRLSHLDEGRIIRRVQPAYPPLAKTARIEGAVLLEAIISRSGRIENLRVISGHPMLATAAKEAVAQWQFRPYVLNGSPVEVLTQITVNFKLARGD
jgi:protein TonB